MRFAYLIVVLGLLMAATPALAVDDFYGPETDKTDDDSRRPDLGITPERYQRDGAGADGVTLGDSAWEEFYISDVHVGPFMDRLYEVLTREDWLGQYPQVAGVAEFLHEAGLFSLERLYSEYEATGDHIYIMGHEGFEDLDPESYYGRFLALPDGELTTAGHVSGDYTLYLAANNIHEMMLVYLDYMMASMEMVGEISGEDMHGDMGELEQVFGMIEAFQLEELVGNVVTGEVALVLYGLPPLEQLVLGDIQPDDIEMAVMIGIKDAEYVSGMIANYGSSIGLMGREYEDDDWTYYIMQGDESIGLMYNDELLIASPNIESTRKHVQDALASGGLDIEPCQMYFDLNIAALHDNLLEPGARLAMTEFGADITLPVEPMRYLVDLPESDKLGHLTFTSYFDDGYTVELEMKKAVLQYIVYYGGLAACGAAQAGVFD